jgi:hypothetical protein
LLCGVVLELGLIGVRLEVELVRGIRVEVGERVGVRVVAGGGVGVRVVLGYDLLAGPARGGSLRVGPADVVGATCEALTEWGAARDGWVAGSHAIAHGDVEFELESDPSSKSACWL